MYIYTPLCRYWIALYRYVLVFIVPHVDIELEDNKQFISNIPRNGWTCAFPGLLTLFREMDMLSGKTTLAKIVWLALWKGAFSKRKEFAPLGVCPFSEEAWFAGKQTGSHESCLPCVKMAENVPSVSSPLKFSNTAPVEYTILWHSFLLSLP